MRASEVNDEISSGRSGLYLRHTVLYVLGIGIVIPILPELIATFRNGDLSAAARYYGWFVAMYAAMQFLFASLLGNLSDRYGRRPVILVALLGTGLD